MPLIYLRPAAFRELSALVASIEPPRTPGDVVLAAVRLGAQRGLRSIFAAHLAAIDPPQPLRGTGRRARRAAAKGAP